MAGGNQVKNQKNYMVDTSQSVPFFNHADECIGTGRMGLALQKQYFEQLKLVQDEIGFRYIRGHGLFSDDMAIYQEYTNENGQQHAEYNFTYLDFVMDSYLELGLRPFLELGFMPKKMASGTQTIFYWEGNVTPPKTYQAWGALVQATLRHLMERYGADEVVCWPIEVWNEPNLAGFWQNADMAEYFRLFEESFYAVKAVDPRFRVGGPSICGVDDERWMRAFLDFCLEKELKIDFITRHHYVSEQPAVSGHYSYVKLQSLDTCLDSVKSTRAIVDSYDAFCDMQIHITEFNTSYVANAVVHDTNYNAAYVAYLLSNMGDINQSYSYWTFGDVFEEIGVPYTPFHGGFGLVANGCIPKPTFWSFQFFKQLEGTCVHRSDDSVIVKGEGDVYRGVCWNLSGGDLSLSFALNLKQGEYCLLAKTVDEACCNPLKLWHDMGEPSHLSKQERTLLRQAAQPMITSDSAMNGDIHIDLSPNALVYFELKKVMRQSDRGYDYRRATAQR